MTIAPEPAAIDYEQLAAEILTQVRQLAQSIPGFGFVTVRRRRQITSIASVPDAFLKSTAVVCDASPDLATAGALSSGELLQGIDFTRAFLSVADEMALLEKGIRDTVAEHRFHLARRAYRVYALAKSFNSPIEEDMAVPHLQSMKRDLGKSRPKRVVDAEPEPPDAEIP